jgi:hypothetical protein
MDDDIKRAIEKSRTNRGTISVSKLAWNMPRQKSQTRRRSNEKNEGNGPTPGSDESHVRDGENAKGNCGGDGVQPSNGDARCEAQNQKAQVGQGRQVDADQLHGCRDAIIEWENDGDHRDGGPDQTNGA